MITKLTLEDYRNVASDQQKNMYKTKKQHSAGIKIPAIINARITNSNDRNPSTAKEKTTHIWY
jgi:hypothetical protein